MELMEISKAQNGEKIILTLSGSLDTATAPQLQEALIPVFNEAKELELNFTELEYISSAGLRVLLFGQKTAEEKNIAMTISGVSPDVMEVLEMTGFTDILTII